MATSLRMMTVRFDLPLRRCEVPFFRGAAIRSAGKEHTMFHNHLGDRFAYRYPLIQYRTFGGRAAMVCINDGIEQIQALFSSEFLTENVVLNGTNRGQIGIEDIRIHEYALTELDTPITYHLNYWLPLNQQNYHGWKILESDESRLTKLEAILTGNILAFAKGMGWQIQQHFQVAIEPQTIITYPSLYKDQSLISFSLDFTVGLFLPPGIGLGKGAALNHGVLSHPIRM